MWNPSLKRRVLSCCLSKQFTFDLEVGLQLFLMSNMCNILELTECAGTEGIPAEKELVPFIAEIEGALTVLVLFVRGSQKLVKNDGKDDTIEFGSTPNTSRKLLAIVKSSPWILAHFIDCVPQARSGSNPSHAGRCRGWWSRWQRHWIEQYQNLPMK